MQDPHREPDNLLELVEQGIIPVVCGFQGVTADHKNVTTLGRGGSDTSAAAFGVAVHADKVEIYTDVDGVMTADPRIVKNAHIIKQISYDEIREMATRVPRSSIPGPWKSLCAMGSPWW